jgi:hypothetical protein
MSGNKRRVASLLRQGEFLRAVLCADRRAIINNDHPGLSLLAYAYGTDDVDTDEMMASLREAGRSLARRGNSAAIFDQLRYAAQQDLETPHLVARSAVSTERLIDHGARLRPGGYFRLLLEFGGNAHPHLIWQLA